MSSNTLQNFCLQYWGQPVLTLFTKLDVLRNPVPVESDDIPRSITFFQSPLRTKGPSRIMMRREYVIALKAIAGNISENEILEQERLPPPTAVEIADASPFKQPLSPHIRASSPSYVISGSPGVGKTLWLHVLLALRVCAALPTVYQKHKDYIYLFNDGRAEKLTLVSDTMDDLLDNIPNNTWWLIDSNLNNFTPPDEVVGELRIVQATSPRSEKTEWVSKTSVDHFFMRTWSVSELFCGRMLQKDAELIDEIAIASFCEKFIPSARNVYLYAHHQTKYEKKVQASFKQVDSAAISLFLKSDGLTTPNQYSHQVFTLVPGGDRFGPCRVDVRPQHLRNMFSRYLARLHREESDAYMRMIRIHPLAKAVAGENLENKMHAKIPAGGNWDIHPLQISGVGSKNIIWSRKPLHSEGGASQDKEMAGLFTLPKLQVVEFVKKELNANNIEGGIYYRPITPNFPTLDAWIMIPHEAVKTAVILQSTVSDQHDLNSSGLIFLQTLGLTSIHCIVWTNSPTISITVPAEYKNFVTEVSCIMEELDEIEDALPDV